MEKFQYVNCLNIRQKTFMPKASVIFFNSLIFVVLLMIISYPVFAQDDSYKTIADPWGRIKFLFIMSNNNVGINDAGSRLGLKLAKKVSEGIKLFGEIELGINLGSTDNFVLSPDNSSTTGFLNIQSVKAGNIFTMRKGFVGADFGKYGTLSIGKQTSAYYDIGSVTDISENNSGYASYVYSPEGSDGGSSGTGRASNSFVYKNSIGDLNIAVSGQFKLSEKKFSNVLNSLGGSLIYSLPFNIYAGATLNGVFLNPDIGDRVRGLKGNPVYSAANLYYKDENLFAGVLYAYQENGDIAYVGDSTVVYSGYGIEIAAHWRMYKKWIVLAGINYKQPLVTDDLINRNFCRLIYFYGLQYQAFSELLFYFEGAVDRSITEEGNTIPDNLLLGIKFNF